MLALNRGFIMRQLVIGISFLRAFFTAQCVGGSSGNKSSEDTTLAALGSEIQEKADSQVEPVNPWDPPPPPENNSPETPSGTVEVEFGAPLSNLPVCVVSSSAEAITVGTTKRTFTIKKLGGGYMGAQAINYYCFPLKELE